MIKKIYLSAALLTCASITFAQVGTTRILGLSSDFAKTIQNLSEASVAERNGTVATYSLATPAGNAIASTVNYRTTENGGVQIAGTAGEKGSFTMNVDAKGKVTGTYTSVADRKAFNYFTDASGHVITKEVAIESVMCMDYKAAHLTPFEEKEAAANPVKRTTAIPKFSSKPGSQYVIYIDLDGEVSKSPYWNNGNSINALPLATYSDADVELIWEVPAQDYLPFDVNVTTDRALFDAASPTKRKMCIVTKTTTAGQPGIGGIAKIGSFSDGAGDPCWVFNPGPKVTGETVAHEVGHTVGLNHDGQGSSAYYTGHNNWAPIMGAAYSTGTVTLDNPNVMGQWSAGEYSGATNTSENDITIIGTSNGFSYRPDEFPDTYTSAPRLVVEVDGTVLGANNQGIIGRRTDKDVFKIVMGPGDINLTVAPYYKTPDLNKHPDLNVQARLLNSAGTELMLVSPDATPNTFASMAATISKTGLAAGTYYIEVDGVGNGSSPSTGYSDFASLGGYNISGTVPIATSVNEEENISVFNIFPNPNNGTFTITFNAIAKSNYRIQVINVLGQQVYEEALNGFSGAYAKPLNLEQYGKGIYMVTISDENSTSTRRVVTN
jgi:hypothetical protein